MATMDVTAPTMWWPRRADIRLISNDIPAEHRAWKPTVSADGTKIAFTGGVGPVHFDEPARIYLHDLKHHSTLPVSPAGMRCDEAHLSADGSTLAFGGKVPGGKTDVYLQPVAGPQAENLTNVPDSYQGHAGDPSLSTDGRFTVYLKRKDVISGNEDWDAHIYVRDNTTGATQNISKTASTNPIKGESERPHISEDGRYVVFASSAPELEAGINTQPGIRQIYVHDCTTGETRCVSKGLDGKAADGRSGCPGISGDGRYIAFVSQATNLSTEPTAARQNYLYLYDNQTGETRRIADNIDGWSDVSLSRDGRYLAYGFQAPTMLNPALAIYDRQQNLATAVGISGGIPGDIRGACFEQAMSADGSTIAFMSTVKLTPAEDRVFGDKEVPDGKTYVYALKNPLYDGQMAWSNATEQPNKPPPTVIRDDDSVVIGGIRVPRRHATEA
jgi:Tol biopolymer transport system component